MSKLIVDYAEVRERLDGYLAALPDDKWPTYAPVDTLAKDSFGWDPHPYPNVPGDRFSNQVKRALNALVDAGTLHKDKGYAGMARYYDQAAWERKLAAEAAKAERDRVDRERWAVVYDRLVAAGLEPRCRLGGVSHYSAVHKARRGCPLHLTLGDMETLLGLGEEQQQ